jgi:hypothetical protein
LNEEIEKIDSTAHTFIAFDKSSPYLKLLKSKKLFDSLVIDTDNIISKKYNISSKADFFIMVLDDNGKEMYRNDSARTTPVIPGLVALNSKKKVHKSKLLSFDDKIFGIGNVLLIDRQLLIYDKFVNSIFFYDLSKEEFIKNKSFDSLAGIFYGKNRARWDKLAKRNMQIKYMKMTKINGKTTFYARKIVDYDSLIVEKEINGMMRPTRMIKYKQADYLSIYDPDKGAKIIEIPKTKELLHPIFVSPEKAIFRIIPSDSLPMDSIFLEYNLEKNEFNHLCSYNENMICEALKSKPRYFGTFTELYGNLLYLNYSADLAIIIDSSRNSSYMKISDLIPYKQMIADKDQITYKVTSDGKYIYSYLVNTSTNDSYILKMNKDLSYSKIYKIPNNIFRNSSEIVFVEANSQDCIFIKNSNEEEWYLETIPFSELIAE